MSDLVEDFSYEDKLLSKLVLEGLLYLFENSLLCDVVLFVEGQKIEAHKSVLAAASRYFRGMFCAGLKETDQREITIHEVSYEAMKSVIHFFYTSCISLNEENIFDIMNVVDLLGVTSLHSACNTFLRRAITVHNCVSVYIMCKLHGYVDVAQEAVRHACHNFSRVMEIEEFFDMPFDMLICCLEGKIINVYSENGLLNRLCAWVGHDVDSRAVHLLPLLDQLNIYTLDLGQAESALRQLPTLESQVYKWLDRVRHIRDRSLTLSTRNRQRFNREHQVVLSCGGLSGSAIANVEALAIGDTMWRCMVPSPSQPHGFRVVPPLKVSRIYAATTYTDDHVFIIGGRNDSGPIASVERFSVDANEWDEFVPLPEPLEGAAATTSNGSIYMSGGFNNSIGITKKAWVLEAGQSSWRSLPPMTHSRSYHGLLAVNGYLYAVAGAGSDGLVQSSVERMSTDVHQWQPISPLQQPRSHFGAVVFDSFIYILGGLNTKSEPLRSVQVYDTLKQEWEEDTPLSVGRHSHGATVASGRVYVAAGSDGVHQLATCEQFNPHTRIWHCQPSLARARIGQAMATITLPVCPPPNI